MRTSRVRAPGSAFHLFELTRKSHLRLECVIKTHINVGIRKRKPKIIISWPLAYYTQDVNLFFIHLIIIISTK